MSDHAVALIGTGPDPDDADLSGFAMAYQHADAYRAIDGAEMVACADLVRENAEAFAGEYGIPDASVYEDYEEMLAEARPDVVSICVPPAVHAEIAIGCLHHDAVEAVHCEKPMALTWGGARRMAMEAWRRDTQLTFNHQRRFGRPFRKAKDLLDAGEIGDLQRVSFAASNIYDYGSHSIDLCTYYNDEAVAEWVIAGIDYRQENLAFGAHIENQATVQWEYENGVHGLGVTGPGTGLVGAHNRIVGSDGVIEVGPRDVEATLRIRRAGQADWEAIDTGEEGMHGPGYIERGIRDVLASVESGGESELRAKNALTATEIIFGAWESSRRRGRVEFPLEIEDNPLEAMVESGELTPSSGEE